MRVLKEAAQADRDAFDRYAKDAGCACHIAPPCSYCTHPGNPMNQNEDETCWEVAYTKDEALFYAICQMRRAARVMEIAAIMVKVPYPEADGSYGYREIYAKGLDMCADECEKVIDPEALVQMKRETFPDNCPFCDHRDHAGVSCFESDACGCGQ